ncbi:MAG: penicillin-binding transpeptidase domain-containing protein [Blautia sp.]
MRKLRKKDKKDNRRQEDFQPRQGYAHPEPQDIPAKGRKKKKRSGNREITIISYFIVASFVSLIGYLAYFKVFRSEDFINSPYNTRQDTFADRVIRERSCLPTESVGRTDVDGEGNETRVYPYANIFAHVVGYASQGKSGLESEANFQLLSSHTFFLEQLKNQFQGQKNQGDNVITTLNTTLQQTAYSALGDRRGAIVVLEPSTGKILAMVVKPDFDPNTIDADWESLINDPNDSRLLNRAVMGQYPPGSVFKVVDALAYYRKNGTLQNFSYLCQGSITMDGHTIPCYGGTVHGQEDFSSAFANSCNCAFVQIGLDMGGNSLRDASEDLLFNRKLPLTMSYKKSTFSLTDDSGVPLTMQTAIGQGNILVSPMHMALITSAIANQGVLMKPYLIDHVENSDGEEISSNTAQAYRTLMSNKEANLLSDLMTGVVTSGTASALSGRSYTVAGKTGSAEYNEAGDSHSWFIGYSNVADPDIAVSIVVEGGGTGSEAAVPIAGEIFDAYYYNQ